MASASYRESSHEDEALRHVPAILADHSLPFPGYMRDREVTRAKRGPLDRETSLLVIREPVGLSSRPVDAPASFSARIGDHCLSRGVELLCAFNNETFYTPFAFRFLD
jgi:hypothetical protein